MNYPSGAKKINDKCILLCLYGGVRKIALPNGKIDYIFSAGTITVFPNWEEANRIKKIFSKKFTEQYINIVAVKII